MRVVKQAALSLSVIVLLPFVVASAGAQPTPGFKQISVSDLKPVVVVSSIADREPSRTPVPSVTWIVDTQSVPRSNPFERPPVLVPAPTPGVAVRATPKPTTKRVVPKAVHAVVAKRVARAVVVKRVVRKVVVKRAVVRSTGSRVVGTATWYCKAGVSVCHYQYPDRAGVADFYAAAGPRLRVGNWRGRVVSVCGRSGCIRVKLVDWCQCYSGTSSERVIDLYFDAFNAVSPGSGGEKVTVSW